MPAPDALSVFRIVMVPIIMALVLADGDLSHNYGIALALFVVTAFTDLFDGYIARRREATTILGAFLDTTADKMLVAGTLLALLAVDRVSAWVAFIIIGRELVVMALRALAGTAGTTVPPSGWGKAKAITQFVAIGFAILRPSVEVGPLLIDEWLMLAAAVITVISGLEYLIRFSPLFRGRIETPPGAP